MDLNRRKFFAGVTALSVTVPSLARSVPSLGPTKPFDPGLIRQLARQIAAEPYEQPAETSSALNQLTYDQYRSVRFRPEHALWRGAGFFQIQFFHPGFIFKTPVAIFEVDKGQSRQLNYSSELFEFGQAPQPPPEFKSGFAGFRIHTPLNRSDYFDEFAVFLGASYFRAVSRNQIYGLSARGLSIRTADPKGEEFPRFRAFWLEKPMPESKAVVVHALLDSESATGAYRFTIRPGDITVFDVEAALYARKDIDQFGIGTLTSMFFFGPNDRVGVDDFRGAVHDSDGLAINNGRGEQLWRPLSNPTELQVSTFEDVTPQSFGLFQRPRAFDHYEDLESRFEVRPSAWIEPVGPSGAGAIKLIEIPTKEEINDNIVSFWQPKDPIKAKSEGYFTYRIHWGERPAVKSALPRFLQTRVGRGAGRSRLFVLEVERPNEDQNREEAIEANVSASAGTIRNVVVQENPISKRWRISFELVPPNGGISELRAQLSSTKGPASEVWLYRWTP